MKISWQVTGLMQDAYANTQRVAIEEDKPAQERGLYLNPGAFRPTYEEGRFLQPPLRKVTWVACFKSLGLRALIGNCFWHPGALARSLTARKSTSNRNDLARAVSIHQVLEFQILGL